MLSLGSRDEGRKGLGLGFRSREGVMEENELEEGEAFSGHEDDSYIDPDIALSYIDEKLQDVLGHFQKDFEGGVSAENLGAKFGGYGSFLPTYQRSPVLSAPKSPPRPPNNAVLKSPYNSSVECAQHNPLVPRITSISKHNTTPAAQPSNSGRKENSINLVNAAVSAPHRGNQNKPVIGSDQKSLKVRIKVGTDNDLAKSNAAIYSGLGLDTPPSSPEDSPDASPGLNPGLRVAPGESPATILEVMTSFSVPGGYLLSPLNENLLHVADNKYPFSRNTSRLGKGVPETPAVHNMVVPVRDTKGYLDKRTKSDEKNWRLKEEENSNCKVDALKMLKKELDRGNDAPANKRAASSVMNISLQSCSRSADPKAERDAIGDSIKCTDRLIGISKELNNKPSGKGKIPDSSKDDQFLSVESAKSGGISNIGNGTSQFKAKLNCKMSLVEQELEEKNTSNHRDISSDFWRKEKSKIQNNHDNTRLNVNEPNGQNDCVSGNAESTKQMHTETNSHEKNLEKMLQGNVPAYQGKKRRKGSHHNCEPITESTNEIPRDSSAITKEKKKGSHTRGGHSECKSKMLKSRKETKRGYSRDSLRVAKENINAVRVENRTVLPESFEYAEQPVERTGVKKDVNLYLEPTANPPMPTSTFAEAAAPTLGATTGLEAPAPVLIEDNWVCCDKCQKWRLLPYGTNPHHLPKKWKCSMQIWLPGLNSCSISEDETTKAFNALYLVPAPENGANLNGLQDVTASRINQQYLDGRPDHNTLSGQATGKKKIEQNYASNIPKDYALKKNLLVSVKGTSSNDVNGDPLEIHFSAKGYLGLSNKLVDLTTEKHNHRQKQKYKISGHDLDGGDIVVRTGKHSNSKGKREANQDGHRTSKKIKKEASDDLVQNRLSDLDMAGKVAPNIKDNRLPSKVNVKTLQNYSDQSSSRDSRNELKGKLSASTKKFKNPVDSNGELKEHFRTSDVDTPVPHGFAAKKRKIKEWRDSMGPQENVSCAPHTLDDRVIVKEAFSGSESRRQKMSKISKSEGKESNMSNVDEKMDKKDQANRNLLSGNRQQRFDGMHDNGGVVARKEQSRKHSGTVASHQSLDGVDSLKREIAYPQLPIAATSSSSKVSSSRKSKGNFQEARGSPVESVSSSPLRISTAVKLSTKRNSTATDDLVVNTGPTFKGSLKRCSDGELGSDQSGTQRKETGPSTLQKSSETRDVDFGVHPKIKKGASLLSGGNNKDESCLRSGQIDISPAEFEETNMTGYVENMFNHADKYISEVPEKDNIDGDRDKMSSHHHLNGISQRKSGKSSSKDRNRISNLDADRCKLKDSEPLDEQNELYLTKNASNCQPEADFNCDKYSTYHEDMREENCSHQEKDADYRGKKNSSAKRSCFDLKNNHSNNGFEENLDAQHKDLNSSVVFAGASSKSNLQEVLPLPPPFLSENLLSNAGLNRIDGLETASSRGIPDSFQLAHGKIEAQIVGSQTVPTSIRGNRSQQHSIDEQDGDAARAFKQSRKPNSQNGVIHSSLRLPHPGGHDSSPMRKDAHAVASVVLKEARDLKHTSNRLKTDGLEHESLGLCFQAALKYLYGAFLLETSSAESAKPGEINSSMQMYSETARLCKFCAHEFERLKEMAAAALAYKCVEVAYMKVAYYKHTGASKDRHELLTTLQTVLPGESPSSSASDVDNLNNQGGLEKTVAVKAVGSPQIAGNQVLVARNRPCFMRLLSYTNDMNCAFDATKRSQNAITVASLSLEKDGAVWLSSVRKVLDFNFQNVEELIRLVRLSMELISL